MKELSEEFEMQFSCLGKIPKNTQKAQKNT